jgi:hypothetical protein
LLHLEALPKEDYTPHSTTLSTEVHGPTKMGDREKKRMRSSTSHRNPSSPPKEEKTDVVCFGEDDDNELTLL